MITVQMFKDLLDSKYIIDTYKDNIEFCRVQDVWDSEDGSDILLCRVPADTSQKINRIVREVKLIYKEYDKGE